MACRVSCHIWQLLSPKSIYMYHVKFKRTLFDNAKKRTYHRYFSNRCQTLKVSFRLEIYWCFLIKLNQFIHLVFLPLIYCSFRTPYCWDVLDCTCSWHKKTGWSPVFVQSSSIHKKDVTIPSDKIL